MSGKIDAVLTLALGGPSSPGEIRPCIQSVLAGRPVPPQRIEEVVRHYEAVGGRSPLTEWTVAQARALEMRLADDGKPLPVFVGMRCWSPWLTDAVQGMADRGLRHAALILMSAYRDTYTSAQYQASLSDARRRANAPALEFAAVDPWHARPEYVDVLCARIQERLDDSALDPQTTPLIFSIHSLPLKVPDVQAYVSDIHQTARLVTEQLGWRHWRVAYQSRTGRPDEPWLEPDVCTAIRDLAAEGHTGVLVACPGFVCDHVEVLYDLDIEAAGVAAECGMRYARAGTAGTHPTFIRMLAALIREMNDRPRPA